METSGHHQTEENHTPKYMEYRVVEILFEDGSIKYGLEYYTSKSWEESVAGYFNDLLKAKKFCAGMNSMLQNNEVSKKVV